MGTAYGQLPIPAPLISHNANGLPQHMHHHPRPHQSNDLHHPQQRVSSVRAHRTSDLPRVLPRRRQRLSARLQTRLRQAQTSFPYQNPLRMDLKHARRLLRLSTAEASQLADGGSEERDRTPRFARVGHKSAWCGVVPSFVAEQGV